MQGRIMDPQGRGLGGIAVTDGLSLTHTRPDGSFELDARAEDLMLMGLSGDHPAHALVEPLAGGVLLTVTGEAGEDGMLMDLLGEQCRWSRPLSA
ncbi:hypothetical protein [Arsenicicoccus dermatophilus]|uniref:hypothetical protein n=1 Tax=Arsenicicoccus dermatophilus TaxID=1076331 RepID=UPI001F4C6769|nr:hypothetical protein [Arsenicicoccus dermatophilus]MCH8612467.1 hypothetical protein [Arsenicicoccus dermatophilus]